MPVRNAPDFIFENVGSHGDVMPMLHVAAELVRRGHRCQLLANEHFRSAAESSGVGFFAVTAQRTHGEVPRTRADYFYFEFDGVSRYFRQPGAFHRHTVVVNTHDYCSSEPLAEAHRLRTVQLILFPVRIPSLLAPPWPLGARALGPTGEHFLKVVLPSMHRAANRHPQVLARINSVRQRVGLAPTAVARYERPHIVRRAALFPEWFAKPAADWPAMELLGFPLPHCADPLPAAVAGFLARNPSPLVFTPGTGIGEPQPFFEAAADCCAMLQRPGILLSPFLSHLPSRGGVEMAHFAHVELQSLLPHCSAIVHHGGLGTTARALQAGIPQIISPVGFDQPDNGHRVEMLGAGGVVARSELSGSRLARALRALEASPELEARLKACRAALARPRAVERAASLLERERAEAPLLTERKRRRGPSPAVEQRSGCSTSCSTRTAL